MHTTELVDKIVAFLRNEVGLIVLETELPSDTFLPGLTLRGTTILFDRQKLENSGDLLHEAGHLAMLPAVVRAQYADGGATIPTDLMDAAELGALAWSYAAITHLGLPPEIVFHARGYHGRSEGLLLGFSIGIFPGLMQLESAGMALNKVNAAAIDAIPFPAMLRWARE
jgi:hypothetical protein